MPDAVLAKVALPANQGSTGEHSRDLEDSALLDAERALVADKGGSADGRAVVGQCGGSDASRVVVNASTAPATPSTVSTIDFTDEGRAGSNGELTSEGTSEGEGRSKTTGPTTVRVPKLNIRSLPPEATPAAGSSMPEYKRQLDIDESGNEAHPAKRVPPLNRKQKTGAIDGASSTSKRARGAPNTIDVYPVDYVLDAFDQCITHLLSMATPMETFIRTRLYRKMFLDFAHHERASSQISTLYELDGISLAASRASPLPKTPGTISTPTSYCNSAFLIHLNERPHQNAYRFTF